MPGKDIEAVIGAPSASEDIQLDTKDVKEDKKSKFENIQLDKEDVEEVKKLTFEDCTCSDCLTCIHDCIRLVIKFIISVLKCFCYLLSSICKVCDDD